MHVWQLSTLILSLKAAVLSGSRRVYYPVSESTPLPPHTHTHSAEWTVWLTDDRLQLRSLKSICRATAGQPRLKLQLNSKLQVELLWFV